jgi:hypothetical protein
MGGTIRIRALRDEMEASRTQQGQNEIEELGGFLGTARLFY